MITRRFWLDVAERAIKTFAQTTAAAVTLGATLTEIDWATAASIGGAAAILSVLTSIGSTPIGDTASAALLPASSGRHHRTNPIDLDLDWP